MSAAYDTLIVLAQERIAANQGTVRPSADRILTYITVISMLSSFDYFWVYEGHKGFSY